MNSMNNDPNSSNNPFGTGMGNFLMMSAMMGGSGFGDLFEGIFDDSDEEDDTNNIISNLMKADETEDDDDEEE